MNFTIPPPLEFLGYHYVQNLFDVPKILTIIFSFFPRELLTHFPMMISKRFSIYKSFRDITSEIILQQFSLFTWLLRELTLDLKSKISLNLFWKTTLGKSQLIIITCYVNKLIEKIKKWITDLVIWSCYNFKPKDFQKNFLHHHVVLSIKKYIKVHKKKTKSVD